VVDVQVYVKGMTVERRQRFLGAQRSEDCDAENKLSAGLVSKSCCGSSDILGTKLFRQFAI